MNSFTCCGPVVRGLVWGGVDETPQAGNSVRAYQDVAAKRSAVNHPDVQGRVKKLVFRQVLWTRGSIQHRYGSENVAKVEISRYKIITTSNHLTSVLKLGFFL